MNKTKILDYLCVVGGVVFAVGLMSYFLYGNYVMFTHPAGAPVTGGDLAAIVITLVIWGLGLILVPLAVFP